MASLLQALRENDLKLRETPLWNEQLVTATEAFKGVLARAIRVVADLIPSKTRRPEVLKCCLLLPWVLEQCWGQAYRMLGLEEYDRAQQDRRSQQQQQPLPAASSAKTAQPLVASEAAVAGDLGGWQSGDGVPESDVADGLTAHMAAAGPVPAGSGPAGEDDDDEEELAEEDRRGEARKMAVLEKTSAAAALARPEWEEAVRRALDKLMDHAGWKPEKPSPATSQAYAALLKDVDRLGRTYSKCLHSCICLFEGLPVVLGIPEQCTIDAQREIYDLAPRAVASNLAGRREGAQARAQALATHWLGLVDKAWSEVEGTRQSLEGAVEGIQSILASFQSRVDAMDEEYAKAMARFEEAKAVTEASMRSKKETLPDGKVPPGKTPTFVSWPSQAEPPAPRACAEQRRGPRPLRFPLVCRSRPLPCPGPRASCCTSRISRAWRLRMRRSRR